MNKLKLTDKEMELIQAIRNYKKSYPRGYPNLLWYVEKLFNELISIEEEDEDGENEKEV